MKPEFSRQISENYSNTKFHTNPYRGSRFDPCQRTDGWMGRHDETIGRFSQFCESPKKVICIPNFQQISWRQHSCLV